MNPEQTASDLLELLGPDNVVEASHCMTRLRLVLKDTTRAKTKEIEALDAVGAVVVAQGQYQIVIGTEVEAVYDAFVAKLERARGTHIADDQVFVDSQGGIQSVWQRVLKTIAQIFTPIIPAIAASGLLKGALTAASLIAKQQGIDITTNDTYVLMLAASQVIFYFMPIILGYTAAKALKCNEVIAMILGGFLCYPQVNDMMAQADVSSHIFGLPIMKAAWTIGEASKVFSYTESVIPILLAVFVLAYLERTLRRIVPQILQLILVPGLSIAIMVPATLVVLGPVGIYVGYGIQALYAALIGFNALLGGAIIGGLWGVLVIFGAHRALLPVGLNDVATIGKQNLLAFAGAANFAQGGAALGVWLKSKSKDVKSVAATAVASAALVGITEPAIYGVNLRFKRPMAAAIIAGAIGGAIMGAGGVFGDAFANNGVLTVFTYAAFGIESFMFYLAGCAVAFFGAAALTYILGFEE